jgi:hypothetical protein
MVREYPPSAVSTDSLGSVPVCLTWPYTSTPTTLPRRNQWGCPKITESPKNPRVNHHFFLIKCFCFLDIYIYYTYIYILHQSHSDCISWWVKRGLKGGLLVTCLSFFVFKMVSMTNCKMSQESGASLSVREPLIPTLVVLQHVASQIHILVWLRDPQSGQSSQYIHQILTG